MYNKISLSIYINNNNNTKKINISNNNVVQLNFNINTICPIIYTYNKIGVSIYNIEIIVFIAHKYSTVYKLKQYFAIFACLFRIINEMAGPILTVCLLSGS